MADNKKYYYLKLKENFFESDTLILLEAQKDGYLYSNILLKLYLRSLKNEGRLSFNNLIPYNVEMLATLTRHQVGTVERALTLFEQLGLIEKLDNGVIYMTDIQNFIGKSSSEADRQRDYQRRIAVEKKSLLESGEENCKKSNRKSNRKSTPELELDIEKDIDIEKDRKLEKEKARNNKDEFLRIVNLFNSICLSLTPIKSITDERIRKIFLIQQQYGYDFDFEKFFKRVEKSDFLTGRNGRWYTAGEKQANFDWIMKLDNISKIQNGIYDNKENSNGRNSSISDEDLEFLSKLGTNL